MEKVGNWKPKFLSRDQPELIENTHHWEREMTENAILGKKEISLINFKLKELQGNGLTLADTDHETYLLFEKLKLYLVQIFSTIQKLELDLGKKKYLDEVKTYLKDIITSTEEGRKILKILAAKNGATFKILDFVNFITQNDCNKFLYEFFSGHKKRMEKFQENLDKISFATKQNFIAKIKQAVEDGEIPEAVENRLKILESSPVNVFDFLTDLTIGLKFYNSRIAIALDIVGVKFRVYDFVSGEILDQKEKLFIESILYHEYLHVIAGSAQEYFYDKKTVNFFKSGVTISGRFTWLNEAITEFLRIYFFPTNDQFDFRDTNGSQIYIKEREKFHEIFGRSFFHRHMRDIINAYFEDFDDSVPVKERFKYFRILKNHINRYGREKHNIKNYFGFLNKELGEGVDRD